MKLFASTSARHEYFSFNRVPSGSNYRGLNNSRVLFTRSLKFNRVSKSWLLKIPRASRHK